MDGVDVAWPLMLNSSELIGTNQLGSMAYPKVKMYCPMSVGDCYSDFHIDFGGSSVWYHIIRGGKVFWLIPPKESTLASFQC